VFQIFNHLLRSHEVLGQNTRAMWGLADPYGACAGGYHELSAMRDRFHWARLLAFVTGLVNQELLLRNEYLTAENRIPPSPPVIQTPVVGSGANHAG
jgi:hypothetical protein